MLNLIRCHCTSFHNNSLSPSFLVSLPYRKSFSLFLFFLLLYDKENLIDYLFFSQFYYLSLKIKFYLNIFFLRRNNMFLTSDLVCCFHGCENRFEVSYVFLFFLFSISNFAPFKFLVFKDLDTNEARIYDSYILFQIFSNFLK